MSWHKFKGFWSQAHPCCVCYLPSPSAGTWVSMVGVGLEPSSGLRVRKKMKETTIIEVNTIYSPEVLNDWDLHMARPRQTDRQTCSGTETQTDSTHTPHTPSLYITHTHTQTQPGLLSDSKKFQKQTESLDWWKTFISPKMSQPTTQLWPQLLMHFFIRTFISLQCTFNFPVKLVWHQSNKGPKQRN